jgi:hypothetical protein
MTRWGVVIVVLVSLCGNAYGIDHTTKWDLQWVESVMPKVREVLEQNIQACNAEDATALLATMHSGLPGRDEFEAEAKQLFEETNIYVRILDVAYDVRYTETDPNTKFTRFAVEVTQHTVVADGDEDAASYFREHSALLPPEYCKYVQTFKLEKGKWKVDKIFGKPIELAGPPTQVVNGIPAWFVRENGGKASRVVRKAPAAAVKTPCANGQCRRSVRSENSVFK